MIEYYTSYICKACNKETILITEEVSVTIKEGQHVSCSHCKSERLRLGSATDDLRKVMNERSYKRHKGAIVQRNL
jgi:DNA-directed RNA polymerase subunit RPC12/RpoP